MKQIDISTRKFPETFTTVDNEDFKSLSQYKWSVFQGTNTLYAYRDCKGRSGFMHRHILDTPEGKFTDHRDGNGLNNQRYNLRVCTRAENNRNCKKHTKSSSAYKGLCWDKRLSLWEVRITFDRKHMFVGRFRCEACAAKAYDIKAMEIFGEFARLNFPDLRT